MGRVTLLVLLLVAGCAKEAPLPPVPPPPEDLSTWSVPEVVLPPVPEPDTSAPVPAPEKPTAAERVYPFTPGTAFLAIVPVGWPLTLMLERGEQVRNIVGGDRAPTEATQTPRFEVKEGAEGLGDTLRPQVFLTASLPGLRTGLVITTTKRTYLLDCKSVGSSPIRVVRWQYPPGPPVPPPSREPGLLPDPAQPKQYHVGYEMTLTQPQAPDWLPRHVIDDGKKMYIVYPEVTLFATAPMVRMVGPNGPQLLNSRQFLNVLIVDQLAPRLELRLGLDETAEVVKIARGTLTTITCPGDAACPVWPQAAQTLARRQP